jgi:chromosome segregation ATPase
MTIKETKMTTALKPPTVEGALTEQQKAQARVEELRSRINAGDPKVTAAQLSAAESDVRLADLRLEAAQEHERQAAAAERERETAAAREALRKLEQEDAEAIRAELQEACDQVAAAVEKAIEHGRQLADAHDVLGERLVLAGSAGRTAPVTTVLESLLPVLKGPAHPAYFAVSDAKEVARSYHA